MQSIGSEIFDVLIIGAGISGIGCACHLTRELPLKHWAILEGREALGGTWDLFKYPGIRSDSDLHTFSYEFKPWTSSNAIASAEEIMAYLRETADQYGVTDKIHFRHRVVGADWNSSEGLWTLRIETPSGFITAQCRWVFSATGYYDFAEAFRPAFSGEDTFTGDIVHPQFWPTDYDYRGKHVAVIGSGATAITLIPAMVEKAAHITQVQRTPTFILPRPKQDKLAKFLNGFLPAKIAYSAIRWKNTRLQRLFFLFCQRFPKSARRLIRRSNMKRLPEGYPVDVHLNPPYEPWDQRLCAAPNGDFFAALRSGKASIETGTIDSFAANGIFLTSGKLIAADLVILATGLKLKIFDGIPLNVDGERVDVSSSFVYRGMMLSGVPNFAFAIGYTNSSWTLKVDLLCQHLCALIDMMDTLKKEICQPTAPGNEFETATPLLNLTAGYVQRAANELPKQGKTYPWEMSLDYVADRKSFKERPVVDSGLVLSSPKQARPQKTNEAV